jgi:DNA-binding NtrC family response regulator
VRHLEQLAARLTVRAEKGPVTRNELIRSLDVRSRPAASLETPSAGVSLEAGLPALMEETEKAWLEEALKRYPGITRAMLAAKLKISESALYKKLSQYQLGG